MSDDLHADTETSLIKDELALFVEQLEFAILQEEYKEAVDLLDEDFGAAWFGMSSHRLMEVLKLLVQHIPDHGFMRHAASQLLNGTAPGQLDSQAHFANSDPSDARHMFLLATLRMGDFRLHGRAHDAFQQGRTITQHLERIGPLVDSYKGAALVTYVQVGISAMLAGDFTAALAHFTQAQMHAPVRKYAFLTRDALAKSALIHACFGNATTARALLDRVDRVPRTSSWVENHIDAHSDFAAALTFDNTDTALDKLETIDLDDIGEMWPFYIVAIFRALESGGRQDELDHRLEMFDSLPFPRVDGDGFSGSIIPLKRAMLAFQNNRSSEARTFLARADPRLSYTQLFKAAGDVYAGRTQQALRNTSRLRHETRGFRSLELRRLAILAAALYQSENDEAAIAILQKAAELPRGLSPIEIQLFSPETRELAVRNVSNWPKDTGSPSVFLTGLPRPGRELTDREIEIVEQLAQGHTRAQMAENLFISVNTLKTQLRSIYRKLEVSSAADAIRGAQRRGLI